MDNNFHFLNRNTSSLLFCAVLFVAAQSARADGLAALLESARNNNPEIKAAQAEWRAAIAKIPQARSLPNPAAALEMMGIGKEGSETTVLLNQTIPWPGTLGRRGDVASLQARATWHEVAAVELRIAARIRILAYEIAYLRKESDIVRSTLDLYTKQEAFLEEVSRGGGESAGLLRIEMESGLFGDESARLSEEIKRQSAELEAIVGRVVSENEIASLTLPEKRPPTPASDLIEKLPVRNPSLQALATRTAAARSGVSLARLETFPEFMLGGGYRRVNEPGMNGGSESMDEALLMFSIRLPVWAEKNRGIREEASAMLEAAQGEYETMHRMLSAQIRIFTSRHRDAARRAALFQQMLLPKARQNLDSVESSYRTGKITLLELLDARRKLLETETGYWRAFADMHINRAGLDALFGTTIETPTP